jgi:tetratricopeptide (TPR) repeat protein
MTPDPAWESEVAALWEAFDHVDAATFVVRLEALAARLPADNAVAPFERACAQDSTGHSDRAVPLYRAALERGLTGVRRRRAVIQLASSLRNLGQFEESIVLLEAERARTSDELDDAVTAVLALAYASAGRAQDGLSIALLALSRHLPRYQRSMAAYARALVAQSPPTGPLP